ncbi:hypothetical protein BurMR1_1367 [Burkholderia sp. MR1]|nr:hypothetical protein BurMR1_1367 [Burkholderia sp. MR1]
MNMNKRAAQFVAVVLTTQFIFSAPGFSQTTDSLYVADDGDNTVKRFGLQGESLGTFVKSTNGLHGPMGLVFKANGDLIVSDQNTGTSANSDILEYDATGQLLKKLVVHNDPDSPVASRGLILWRDSRAKQDFIFVADFTTEPNSSKPPTPGRLLKYTAEGKLVDTFVPSNLSFGTCAVPPPGNPVSGQFHPRGLVLGPDGLIYISSYTCTGSGLRGQVIRFDPLNGRGAFKDVFIDSSNDLNRPEGLVFGPDGYLYITSFRADKTDSDKILVFQGPSNGSPGSLVNTINLYTAGDDAHRVYAQALLFGPGGKLFVPISGGGPSTTEIGSVRRYDLSNNWTASSSTAGLPTTILAGRPG